MEAGQCVFVDRISEIFLKNRSASNEVHRYSICVCVYTCVRAHTRAHFESRIFRDAKWIRARNGGSFFRRIRRITEFFPLSKCMPLHPSPIHTGRTTTRWSVINPVNDASLVCTDPYIRYALHFFRPAYRNNERSAIHETGLLYFAAARDGSWLYDRTLYTGTLIAFEISTVT